MSSQPSPKDTEVPARAAQKRTTILEAAKQAFFENGFVGTSMDQVAATAGVSKQTVYKHFTDKDTLFREVVTDVVHARDGGIPESFLLEGDGPIDEQLRGFARDFLKGVMQPDVLKLRRLVIGEAGRFPELGRAFYELGPQRAAEQLAVGLRRAADKQGLAMDDPAVAAAQFLSLVLSVPLERAMLLGGASDITREYLDRSADEGVVSFVRAFGFSI